MRSSTLFVAALIASVSAHSRGHNANLHKRHSSALTPRSKKTSTSSSSWSLSEDLSGDKFADAFDFVTGQSDNGGLADYQSQSDASDAGIFYVTKNNSVYIGTDTTQYAGNLRKAIKATSKKQYSNFMLIADIGHMPAGCGAWPALWMTGDNWPAGGEIDLIEYVSDQSLNSYSIHTGDGCTMGQSGSGFSAKFMMADTSQASVCAVDQTSAQGCGTRSIKANSAGPGANSIGGGVYAVIQDWSGVTMYGFNHTEAPSDIYTDNPDPSGWGTPDFFVSSSTCPTSSFSPQTLIVNTNYGGTWPSGVWDADNSYADQDQSCAASTGTSMEDYILNHGSGFSEAYWLINSMKVFTN